MFQTQNRGLDGWLDQDCASPRTPRRYRNWFYYYYYYYYY